MFKLFAQPLPRLLYLFALAIRVKHAYPSRKISAIPHRCIVHRASSASHLPVSIVTSPAAAELSMHPGTPALSRPPSSASWQKWKRSIPPAYRVAKMDLLPKQPERILSSRGSMGGCARENL